MDRKNNPKYKSFVDNAIKSPNLCIHIKDNIEECDEKMKIYPVYEQNFLSDSFISFWFCEQCFQNCKLPKPGVKVYHEDFDELSFQDDIKIKNPYKDFIDENIKYTVRNTEFIKKYRPQLEIMTREKCNVVDFLTEESKRGI